MLVWLSVVLLFSFLNICRQVLWWKRKQAIDLTYVVYLFSAVIVFLSPMHTSKKRTISKVFLQHQIYWRTFRSPMSSLIPSNIFFMVNIMRSYSSCIHSLSCLSFVSAFFRKGGLPSAFASSDAHIHFIAFFSSWSKSRCVI